MSNILVNNSNISIKPIDKLVKCIKIYMQWSKMKKNKDQKINIQKITKDMINYVNTQGKISDFTKKNKKYLFASRKNHK